MCGNKTVKMTRNQLYAEVWAEPMTRLSKKYGLSDVGLAKVCKRNNIPRPPAGHWAKLAHGKKVKTIPLPKMDDPKPIEFHALFDDIGTEDPKLPSAVHEHIEFELQPKNRIVVPETLLNPLPCIRTVRTELLSSKEWWDGLLHTETWPQIWVTKPLIPRALRVMDSLVKALDERGYREKGIFEQPIAFGIYEHLQSTRTERAIAEDRGWGKSTGYSASDYERVPSGRLKLEVITRFTFRGKGLQRNWIDGKTQKIEDCLNEFICGLIRWAAVGREQNLKWDRWKREREEREQAERERAEREAARKARIDGLYTDADNWGQARQLREYIAAAAETNPFKKSKKELAEWEKWARAEADRIDPLTS